MTKNISFVLNHELVEVQIDPGALLANVLRDHFHLTGTKIGCQAGDCGACTVIMNGRAVNSCLIPVGKAQEAEILTIEGLGQPDNLHPLQQAFIDCGAVQCGMCIPGMIMAGKALLDENPDPGQDEIREGMSGNICRCTGYVKIEKAVQQAAAVLRREREVA